MVIPGPRNLAVFGLSPLSVRLWKAVENRFSLSRERIPKFDDITSAMAKGRQSRKCIFCGANADSKEHIWSEWLHPHLLAADQKTRHNRLTINFHPDTGQTERGSTMRQGDVRTIRVRAVCSPCNNGWMNKIEEEARPFLTPIVIGTKTSLDPVALQAVARWLALKIVVAEHDTGEAVLTPKEDRIALMESGAIPPYFRMYAGHNIGNDQLYFRRHSHCVARSTAGPNPPLIETNKNIQVATIVIGCAVFQLTASRSAEFLIEDHAIVAGFHDRSKFWPDPPSQLGFPARPRLNSNGIEFIAGILDRFIKQANAVWMPLGAV